MNAKIIILAAGNSSRLGKKKQLLTHRGSTLLNHAIDLCLSSQLGEVYIVLGHAATEINNSIISKEVKTTINRNWSNGMGSSISTGIKALPASSTGAYILLTDQIKLTTEILLEIGKKSEEFPHSIICCRYMGNYGAPCFFPKTHFNALRKLEGASGAKHYIKGNIDQVKFVDFNEGEVDIDLPEDLDKLED